MSSLPGNVNLSDNTNVSIRLDENNEAAQSESLSSSPLKSIEAKDNDCTVSLQPASGHHVRPESGRWHGFASTQFGSSFIAGFEYAAAFHSSDEAVEGPAPKPTFGTLVGYLIGRIAAYFASPETTEGIQSIADEPVISPQEVPLKGSSSSPEEQFQLTRLGLRTELSQLRQKSFETYRSHEGDDLRLLERKMVELENEPGDLESRQRTLLVEFGKHVDLVHRAFSGDLGLATPKTDEQFVELALSHAKNQESLILGGLSRQTTQLANLYEELEGLDDGAGVNGEIDKVKDEIRVLENRIQGNERITKPHEEALTKLQSRRPSWNQKDVDSHHFHTEQKNAYLNERLRLQGDLDDAKDRLSSLQVEAEKIKGAIQRTLEDINQLLVDQKEAQARTDLIKPHVPAPVEPKIPVMDSPLSLDPPKGPETKETNEDDVNGNVGLTSDESDEILMDDLLHEETPDTPEGPSPLSFFPSDDKTE